MVLGVARKSFEQCAFYPHYNNVLQNMIVYLLILHAKLLFIFPIELNVAILS
jgi:hypothetical protein